MASVTRDDKEQHLASTRSNAHPPHNSSPHIMTTMFGALNRFISRLDAAPEEQQSATRGAFGFQVLRNTNPEVPLEPWFDYIIGINGRTIVSQTIIGSGQGDRMKSDDPDVRTIRTQIYSRRKSVTALAPPLAWASSAQR